MKGIKRRDKILYFTYAGQRRNKSYSTEEKAEEALRVIEGALLSGDITLEQLVRKPVSNENVLSTVEDFQKVWMELTVPDLKKSTQEDYKCIVRNHISKARFYKQPIDTVTRGQLKRFLKGKLNGGLSHSTVTHIKNALGKIFAEAVDEEIIGANPVHGIKLGNKKNDSRKPQIQPYEVDEVNTLLTTFRKKHPLYYPLVLLLVNTGCRIGEACALQWQDIDFEERTILIRRNFVRNRIEDSTKNSKDRRIDMPENLSSVLNKLKKERIAESLEQGRGGVENDWIFKGVKDPSQPLNYHTWRRDVFYPALEVAKLRKIRVHDLRHTFASIMIGEGCNLVYIRDQLGHHSIQVTADVYGHLLKGNKEKPVDVFDSLLNLG